MKSLRVLLIMVMAVIGSGLRLSPSDVHAQCAAGNAVLLLGAQTLYMVDLTKGEAFQLPVELGSGKRLVFSPDRRHLAVLGQDGIVLYRIEGSRVERAGQIAGLQASGADWAGDGKSLVYFREIRTPNGGWSAEVYIWDRETDQTKRLM